MGRLTLSLLFIWAVSFSFPSWSTPYFSSKYDAKIKTAVKDYWPDVPFWKLWKAQLYQESHLKPDAVSPVGARGLAQFMPMTWKEVSLQLGISGDPSSEMAIAAGAYYMAKQRKQWKAERTSLQRHELAQASYNAGLGNILKAQALCKGVSLWPDISPCLVQVTGKKFSHETITYVSRIRNYWQQMEALP